LVGGFGVGFVTTGGTTTGGTTTGGTTTGGTTTGGTTTGGTTTGGTTTGGTTTGGTLTGSGTAMVMVTGFERVGGLEPVVGRPDVEVLGTDVAAGVGVPVTVAGAVTVLGAGLADGVGVPVPVWVWSLGTTISGLPPPAGGVEPKYDPATGRCEAGDTTALDPTTITLTVAAVAMPTNEAAATRVLVEVAASAEGRCNPAPSFTAVAPPWICQTPAGHSARPVARDDYSIRTVLSKSLSVVSVAEWPNDTDSYRHKTSELKRGRREKRPRGPEGHPELKTAHRGELSPTRGDGT
jgi:hypothetical protein